MHLTPSDAAYVLLAAAADSTPSEVVEVASTLAGLTWGKDAPGDQRGGLRRHLNPEWSTFHAALTDIVAGKLVAAIHLVTIRPHLRQAEINLTFGFGSNDPVKSTLNFSNFDTLSADRLRSYTSMNTAFEIGPQFIAEVQTLIAQGDSGEMVPE
ncbi:MAG: hypothetical protein EP340_00095 [Alphaproteobacteria bacterium]|nr:MAG: hypothetical protein EP340_00095 [Alphaproteobacteria bacterium]